MLADVVVIGGGIVGASCAYFLTQEGLKVALVERAHIASGTSGAGEGNIPVSDKQPGPELALALLGRQLWQELAETLSDDIEFDAKGGILVAESAEDWQVLVKHTQFLRAGGVMASLLTREELREMEPHLAHDVAGAAYFPQDAQANPPLVCNVLVKHAQQRGLLLLDHTEVTALERDSHNAIKGVQTSQGTIITPCVVNAAGPWSPQIAELVDVALPVTPRKGHLIVTEPLPPLARHLVVEAKYLAAVTEHREGLQVASVVEGVKGGRMLLGSSRQFVGFDATIEEGVVQAILQRAQRYFPLLASLQNFHARMGFRPCSPDHLPILGEVSAVPGFYVNTGHEGAGFCLGPISGKVLSQFILRQSCAMDMTAFSPARFHGASHVSQQ